MGNTHKFSLLHRKLQTLCLHYLDNLVGFTKLKSKWMEEGTTQNDMARDKAKGKEDWALRQY